MIVMFDNELLKKRELEIVKEFHEICEKNGLKYTLAFGSMIGCVRHGGFIPWDDDIDVVMPYGDYERFCEIAAVELDSKYILQNFITDKNYRYPFAKLRLKKSCLLSRLPSDCPWEDQGIYIDIFVAMYVPASTILRSFINISNSILGQINKTFTFKRAMNTQRGNIGRCLLFICLLCSKIVSHAYLINCLYKNALKASRQNSCDLYLCDFNQPNMINRFRLGLDAFDDRLLMKFEDTCLYMPRRYDEIMRKFYGDYMQLPPEKDRKTHGFIYIDDTESYKEYMLRNKHVN